MNHIKHYDFRFQSGVEEIQATLDYCGRYIIKPTIISLHGAGPSNRNRISYLTSFLAIHDHPCLRFDFSGHPDSTGKLAESSLNKRLKEAVSASQFLKKDSSYTVIATSMGGHVALELLPLINIKNLILFCPAAYTSQAFDIPFGKGFSEIIRQPNSYKDAQVFDNLRSFTGNILLLMGQNDEIIPSEVIEMYDINSANCVKKEFFTIPNAPHAIHAWLTKELEWKEVILNKVLKFIG